MLTNKYKYEPTSTLTNDLFDALIGSSKFVDFYSTSTKNSSNVNVHTEVTEEGISFFNDIPGVKAIDVDVKTVGHTISISGKSQRCEFKTSYSLSKDYDPDSVDAELEDGVLMLKFRKSASSIPKKINVKSSLTQ